MGVKVRVTAAVHDDVHMARHSNTEASMVIPAAVCGMYARRADNRICRPRRALPHSKISCMALPSTIDGATTITAPKPSSKDLSVPTNLAPVSDLFTVPGGKGRAIELKAGQYFKVTNTYGEQVLQSPSVSDCSCMYVVHCNVVAWHAFLSVLIPIQSSTSVLWLNSSFVHV